MNEDQIWQQLDLRAGPLCSNLQLLEGETADDVGLSEEMDGLDDEEEGMSELSEDFEAIEDSDGSEEEEEAAGFEEVTDLREESEGDEDESDYLSLPDIVDAKRSSKRAAVKTRSSELDDDFFSLDAFNRETEEAEAAGVSRGRLGGDSEEDESDYEDGSIDLFKPVDDVENPDEDASEDGAGMQCYIILSFMAQTVCRAVLQRFLRSSKRLQVDSYHAHFFLEIESALQRSG
jgi:U3 small nucleolar RNA-associated protein MPP10